MHGHALENGEKDFGSVVGQDDKGKAPQDGGEAGDETEDAVEEEKGGVFEGGRANAVENFHRDDSLSGVRVVEMCRGHSRVWRGDSGGEGIFIPWRMLLGLWDG